MSDILFNKEKEIKAKAWDLLIEKKEGLVEVPCEAIVDSKLASFLRQASKKIEEYSDQYLCLGCHGEFDSNISVQSDERYEGCPECGHDEIRTRKEYSCPFTGEWLHECNCEKCDIEKDDKGKSRNKSKSLGSCLDKEK